MVCDARDLKTSYVSNLFDKCVTRGPHKEGGVSQYRGFGARITEGHK